MAELERTPACLSILHVAHSRYRGYVETRAVCHILEYHGFHVALIAVLEVFALYVDYRLHGDIHGVLPLLHGVDESLCPFHFLLGIEQRLLVASRHRRLVCLVALEQFGERGRDIQVWHMAAVDGECHGAVVGGIHYEVWRYLLHVSAFGLAERCPRLGIQAEEF